MLFLKILDKELHCIPNQFCDFSHVCHFPFPIKAQRIEDYHSSDRERVSSILNYFDFL